MPMCIKCGETFPNRIKVDGKIYHTQRRKYCLQCSPLGEHNTRKIHEDRKCLYCGETDPTKFYGNKKKVCAKCHNQDVKKRGQDNREFAIDQLGGKCVACGYDTYLCSLDIHHTDADDKDENFRSMRGWSKERILKEIEQCILLCRNCHQAHHSGYDVLK